MADIGEEIKEVEFEPIPDSVPAEPVPAQKPSVPAEPTPA